MSIKIGSIAVDLTANTVSFTEGLTKASTIALNSSRNIQRSLSLISVGATAMASAVIASLTATIEKTEDFAFSIQEAADQVGTSSEMFSKLAYNAKLAGTPTDSLRTSMERLAKSAYAAKDGSKESVAAFAAIGISTKDLQGPLKDSGDLMVAVSKKLDGFAESTSTLYAGCRCRDDRFIRASLKAKSPRHSLYLRLRRGLLLFKTC
jgi:hypothetical protein